MPQLKFSVPYNNNPATLGELLKTISQNGNSIEEVYLSGPQLYSGSGRLMPKMQSGEFAEIVQRIHGAGVRVNLIFNPTCEGIDWYSSSTMDAKIGFLREMYEQFGIETVTIANPIYIKEVRHSLPDIEICASVLGDIDSLEKAIQFARVGASVITPDVNINRNLSLLKEIKEATGVRLKLMVNEGCLSRCAFRKFHFDFTSHKSREVGVDYWGMGLAGDDVYADFFGNCLSRTAGDFSQTLRSGWIRPEDCHKYAEVTDYFKIVGRDQPSSFVLRATRAYLNEKWQGNLFDILCASLQRFSQVHGAKLENAELDRFNFFDRVTSCDKKCINCSFCADVANELLTLGAVTQEQMEDKGIKLPD